MIFFKLFISIDIFIKLRLTNKYLKSYINNLCLTDIGILLGAYFYEI